MPLLPARSPSGSTTRRPACATCISTTTAVAATATGTARRQRRGRRGPVLAAARAVGATIALELTNEADVLASLEYLRAHDLLSLRIR